jgi:hypothetical protein
MTKFIFWLVVLALGCVTGPMATLAHPLPDSTLTLTPEAGRLEMTLTIPVSELILAQPTLAELAELPDKAMLPTALQKNLTTYLQQHMALTTDSHPAADVQVTSASVSDAKNENVDHYDLLTVKMVAPSIEIQKLSLTYDAVLHEVRNHRLSVWLAQEGKDPLLIGKIRYDAALGRAKPLLLPNIP